MSLDPLKFQVAIQDDATKQLGEIEKKFQELKDKTISVRVEGLQDLRDLLSALQHKQVETIGKDVASGIHDAAKGLQEEAQKAVRTSLGNLAQDLVLVKEAIKNDNFSAFSTRILKCAEAVNTLDEAFKKFNVTIGSDAGMKNFMTGLDEVIKNVRTTIGSMESIKNGSSLGSLANTYARNVERMEEAMRRIRETRLALGDKLSAAGSAGISVDNRQIYMLDAYMRKLETIRRDETLMHGTGWQTSTFGNSYKTLLSGAESYMKYLDRQMQKQATIETNQRRYNVALEESGKLLTRLDKASTQGISLGIDTSKTEKALKDIQQFIDKLTMFDSKKLGDNHVVNELIAEYTRLKTTLGTVAREQERLNATTEKNNQKVADTAAKQAQKDNEKWAESMRTAGIEATKLEIQIRKLQDAENRAKTVGIDTSNLSAKIAELQSYVGILRSIEGGSKIAGHTRNFMGSVDVQNSIRLANEEATAIRRAAQEKEKAVGATRQLSSEEQRLAQALNHTTESARGQSQVLGDLKSMATQYLGVWGGQQFLHNIIEIGGQLEMQRLSIGAILQNTSQANELFDRIKGLATQSPFGVVQLDQMTKQLTAYGFKYNELFDMTKRLADISAATGTDVSRLALALGHVRSEAALSGYTLRQFSMGNVPLLQKLAEKLGKTTKQIREMVKGKEISYDDVLGVLKDLTNEGGMFHNMQEVISESVKAKFKNVKDAMDIMYGEMAEGAPGEALKEVANVLMEVTKNWKDVATVLGTGVAVWATHRAAILLYTKVLGEANVATINSIATFRAKEATQLKLAKSYRTLTATEQAQITNSKRLTLAERTRLYTFQSLTMAQKQRIVAARQELIMGQALALSSKKLTAEDIARQVATGKLTATEARRIIILSDLTAAEKAAALAAISNIRTYGRLTSIINGASTAFVKFGMAMKAVLLSPQMWIMAGITAIMELWQRNSREMEAAEELSDKIYEHSQEGLKNTRTMMESTGIRSEWRANDKEKWSDVTNNFGGQTGGQRRIVFPAFDMSNAESSIEAWIQYIRDYAATPNRILNEALFDTNGNVRSLAEQFDNLKVAVKDVAEAQVHMQSFGDAFENAINATNGGLFNDDVLTNISDYEKDLKKFNNSVTTTYRQYRKAIDGIISKALQQDKAFAKAAGGMGTYAAQFNELMKNIDKYPDAKKLFDALPEGDVLRGRVDVLQGNNLIGLTGMGNVNAQKAEMEADLESFYIQLQAELETKGIEIGSMSEAQQQALLLGYKDKLNSIQGLSQETFDYLIQKFATRFKIELDVNNEKFKKKTSESERLLKGLSNSDWNVNMNYATNINDAIEEARKQYKAAKEYYNNAKPILVKFGIQAKMGQEFTDKQIEQMVNKAVPSVLDTPQANTQRDLIRQTLKAWSEASRVMNQATDASKAGGFSLEDPKKKNGKGSKTYKDEFAKRWDERIRIMKEAYDWYDKWEKKVGKEEAINKVVSRYGDIFKEWKTDKLLPMNFDVNNIEDFLKYVEKIRDDALARYSKQKNDKSKNNGQEAQRVLRQANALLEDFGWDTFGRAAEKFKSEMDLALSDLQRKWDMFNEVSNATGSREIAANILGMDDADRSMRNLADATRSMIESSIANMGDAVKVPIAFDINMSDKQIEENVKNALGGTEYQERIDSIVEAIKKWRELQRNVIKDDISSYAKLIGSAVDYESQLKKINNDLEDKKSSNASLVKKGKISQEDANKANKMAETQAEDKRWKISLQYVTLMNSSLAMTRKQVEAGVNTAMAHLNSLLDNNLITAKEFADEMGKLRDIQANWDKNALFGSNTKFTAFLKGGLGGLEQYYTRQITEAETTMKSKDATDKEKESAALRYNKNKGFLESLQKTQNKLSGVALVSEMVMGAFDGLQKAAQSLYEMFDALGNEGAANFWSDVSDTIGGISSIFAPVNNMLQSAMSGNVSGMISSAIAAPVQMIAGPITAFSQLHDKKIERHIAKIREDVQKIENNTSLIQQARARTLGYDMGDVRRSYAQQYAPSEELKKKYEKSFLLRYTILGQGFTSQAQKDMYDYYSQNSSGTGYQQEYRNLLQQREDYINILGEQESKKKKSQSDIDETMAKISELDDQIRYFTQDLAKELWDIDVKGWADQLSDALASAFENGENMAKAYNDTVTSILQKVMSKMMQMSILEQMFQSLQDKLFGKEGQQGLFDLNDPQGSMSKVTATIADFFGKGGEGERAITGSTEFMTAFQRGLEKAGLSVLNDSANTLSASVQGASEETSALLAGYVNALRQDVAVNRILFTQFVAQLWPEYVETFANHVRTVANIDVNVQLMMEMMRDGNGALFNELSSLRSRFDSVVDGIESLSIK